MQDYMDSLLIANIPMETRSFPMHVSTETNNITAEIYFRYNTEEH